MQPWHSQIQKAKHRILSDGFTIKRASIRDKLRCGALLQLLSLAAADEEENQYDVKINFCRGY
jgi:hypothetical protein